MAELVIRGGTVVDGTGAAASRGDVLIRDGRIAAVGDVSPGSGSEVLDASDCWVTPGFIDPHTHLDAQLCWDPTGSPSNLHGVTTVVMGLCGFGVAPCPEGGDEYLLRSLEVVEEIPYASTRAGVPFGWHTWAEYFDHIGEQPLALNAASAPLNAKNSMIVPDPNCRADGQSGIARFSRLTTKSPATNSRMSGTSLASVLIT